MTTTDHTNHEAAPACCHRCQRITPTTYLPLRGGLIGNLCAVCRACRKGRPFVTRREYESTLKPVGADGGFHVVQAHEAHN